MSEKQDYAKWITRTRIQRGWTTVELAERCGFTSNLVWHYENQSKKHPDPKNLAKIAEVLGYPPEVLLKLAGFPINETVDQESELAGHVVQLMKQLSPEDQAMVVNFTEYLATKRDKARLMEEKS